jgi:hypothetical protein
MSESNSKDYEWLLEARAKNQRLILRLYDFGRTNGEVLQRDPNRQDLFAFLVGAVFSLWRAAFLSDTIRAWPETFKGANDLLKTLIEDNAVTYPTDRKTKEWMGGYYLNNAAFRLFEARTILLRMESDVRNNQALVGLDHSSQGLKSTLALRRYGIPWMRH